MNSYVGVLVLLAALLPGLVVRRRGDFFLGGRRAGAATVTGSLFATCLGASGTLGIVGLGYRFGWPAFWWLGSGGIGLVLLGLFWVAPMRSRDSTRTLPEWVGDAYGAPARVLAAALIVVMWVAVIAAQLAAAGTVLRALSGWPLHWGIVAAAVGVVSYIVWGGQRSVLRTDVWQGACIAAAILLPVIFLRRLPAAAPTATGALPASVFAVEAFTLTTWLSVTVVVGGMYIVGPDLCSRVLIARDNRAARRGAVVAGIALLPCSLLLAYIGVAVRRAGAALDTPSAALPWLIGAAEVMPVWIGFVVNFGLLAAMISSADTCLLTASTVLELDLVGRKHAAGRQERLGRLFVCLIGAASAVLAVGRPGIIPNLLLAYAFYAGGLLAPLLMLAFPRAVARLPRPWVWAAMAVGGSTPVVLLVTKRVADSATAGLCGVAVAVVLLVTGAVLARSR